MVDLFHTLDTNAAELSLSDDSPDVFVTLSNGVTLEEHGEIVFIDNQISSTTGTVALLAEFQNERKQIVDGAFLSVRIAAPTPTLRLVVPQAAIQRDQRGDFVLVVNSQQMVEQRYVETGDQVGTELVVNDGLQAGESVIVEGLQRVRPGVQVDPVLTGQQEG